MAAMQVENHIKRELPTHDMFVAKCSSGHVMGERVM